MTNTADSVGSPPSPARQISSLTTESDESSELENKNNSLQAELIQEKIHRDQQRKEHRGIVFVAISIICFSFYAAFISFIAYIYSDMNILKDIPVLWVAPLLGLVTVPTILLVMMVLALYRKSAEEMPSGALRVLESLSRISK